MVWYKVVDSLEFGSNDGAAKEHETFYASDRWLAIEGHILFDFNSRAVI